MVPQSGHFEVYSYRGSSTVYSYRVPIERNLKGIENVAYVRGNFPVGSLIAPSVFSV